MKYEHLQKVLNKINGYLSINVLNVLLIFAVLIGISQSLVSGLTL